MVSSEMVYDAHVLGQAGEIASRQHQIEVISPITLLDHAELAVNVRCLPLHMVDLLIAQAAHDPALIAD